MTNFLFIAVSILSTATTASACVNLSGSFSNGECKYEIVHSCENLKEIRQTESCSGAPAFTQTYKLDGVTENIGGDKYLTKLTRLWSEDRWTETSLQYFKQDVSAVRVRQTHLNENGDLVKSQVNVSYVPVSQPWTRSSTEIYKRQK